MDKRIEHLQQQTTLMRRFRGENNEKKMLRHGYCVSHLGKRETSHGKAPIEGGVKTNEA